ncbi:MAG TPA: LytR C-terminal domain-containing protein [Patescibacteria group bacterium]|nr:LytR C-terminal domain-containing protein [Patescibacteria group bacterium]
MILLLAMEEENNSEIFQSPPEFQSRLSRPKASGNLKRYGLIVFAIIVLGLVIFGVTRFIGGSSNSNSNTTETPTPTIEMLPTDTPTPTEDTSPTPATSPTKGATATPAPTKASTGSSVDKATGLDRAKLSIHVLNGSGTAGASKKMSDFLEGLGYNVIQIGNADNFDYTNTEIQVANSKSDYIALLKKDLSANYTVGSTSGTPPSDEQADAIVIVGKQ